jgi:SH3-like domain-containing protein
MRRGVLAALAVASACICIGSASANGAATLGTDSHLPVPRFVSLRTEGANGRHGPGVEHRIDWIYERAGLPLQVTGESGPWRRVKDPDGAVVWMHAQNLDQRRTAYVRQASALRRNPSSHSGTVAYLAAGVVGAVTGCEGDWRRVAVGGRVGWVENAALWGAADCSGL